MSSAIQSQVLIQHYEIIHIHIIKYKVGQVSFETHF
jgi:hypothetical protein